MMQPVFDRQAHAADARKQFNPRQKKPRDDRGNAPGDAAGAVINEQERSGEKHPGTRFAQRFPPRGAKSDGQNHEAQHGEGFFHGQEERPSRNTGG